MFGIPASILLTLIKKKEEPIIENKQDFGLYMKKKEAISVQGLRWSNAQVDYRDKRSELLNKFRNDARICFISIAWKSSRRGIDHSRKQSLVKMQMLH